MPSMPHARSLVRPCEPVTAAHTANQIVRKLHDEPSLNCLPVVDDQYRVIGVLRSLEILRRGTEPYFQELTGRRSCTHIMDTRALVFDAAQTVLEMSKAVAQLDDRQLIDGFFVTEGGTYLGAGRMTDLIRAVTEQQINTARYANPLTLLPGNVPIDEHIQACINTRKTFVVGYFDLDNFKAFNDVYGFRAGDDIIQLAANVLRGALAGSGDFLGHIGGDDFVVVFTSPDWETRVTAALQQFDQQVRGHFQDDHLKAGGLVTHNRQGVSVFHALVSLSAGLIRVAPGEFSAASEISYRLVEAKQQAKKLPGSSFFVDRRCTAAPPTI